MGIMRIVLALVGAPLLALVDQSTAFALVSWSCIHAGILALHFVHFLFLAATVALAFLAAHWRVTMRAEAPMRSRFLAGIATASAVLSALAIAAMWMPVWMISPCIA
jgi:hypothetical protein